LAEADQQKSVLRDVSLTRTFEQMAENSGHETLRAIRVDVLQVNLGKRCNLACKHCHVDAGPDRREVMPDHVVEACLDFVKRHQTPTLDLTGGAPEMHPRLPEIIKQARSWGTRVIHRTNLTVLTLPAYQFLTTLFAAERVELAASLPWYAQEQTDGQRGEGVFQASIQALRRLNQLGYGHEGTGLLIDLVTNPSGAFLPASQTALEGDWKREMRRRHGVEFNRLLTITNMPISRYLDFLIECGQLEAYMEKLVAAFNPCTVGGVMCRTTLSVGWDGRLYDCDFNQMLDLPLARTILDVDLPSLLGRSIRTGAHCFGCTAGCGSSCGGATSLQP
jgi:radical SAM/Cys-rich protein